METHYTEPELAKLILIRLREWRTDAPFTLIRASHRVFRAIRDQDKLGWWFFLLGRIPKSITRAQQYYIQQHHPRRSIDTWSRQFLAQVWDVSFLMWEHRNNAVHGEELTPTKTRKLEVRRQAIRLQFTMDPTTVLPSDRWRLKPDAKDWALNLSYDRTKIWLEHIELSRVAYTQKQQQFTNEQTQHRARLRNWLLPLNPNMPP